MSTLTAFRSTRYLVVLATAALLAVLVTACGGDDSSSGETGATSTESSSGSTGEGGAPSAAAKFVEEAEQEPQFAITKALPSKPEPGKNVFCLKNEVAQSQTICNGVRAASEAVGFNYQERAYEAADASALVILMKEILQSGNPDVVIFGGDPEAIWGQVKPAYEKAGVILVPAFVGPAEMDAVTVGNVAGPSTQEKAAKVSADWFIADSGGKGKAIIQTVPGFPVITEWQGYFEEEVAKECPECSVESIEASLEELGSGAAMQALVSALQSDQEIGYAIAYNTNFLVGIANELKNAGIPDVKIGGWSGTAEGVTDILNGQDYGWILFNQEFTGWQGLAFYLNHLAGVELTPEEEVMPMQLITGKNATKEIAETANEYGLPSDYREQFKKLWGVG